MWHKPRLYMMEPCRKPWIGTLVRLKQRSLQVKTSTPFMKR